ncbi:MAG: FAD:protein FMN transferase [Acidimicrobiia bacterium]
MPGEPLLPESARFRAMGTDVEVLALGDAGAGEIAGRLAEEAIERLEVRWSRFRPTSELCRLNAADGAPVVVSPETFALIERAVGAWRTTGGLYDPTILAALEAAGYDRSFDTMDRSGLQSGAASPATPPAAAPSPGCAGITLDPLVNAVRLPRGVTLDLGGIGKGYAADLVAAELITVSSATWRGVLVNMGGDLRAAGDAPEPSGWVVEVDDPLATGRTGLLSLAAGAIATSTRLRRSWSRDGRALHHLIDPRTGLPTHSGLASVTVIAGEAWRAEVLAKAVFVAGRAAAARIVADAGATGLLVTDDGEVDELAGLAAFRP